MKQLQDSYIKEYKFDLLEAKKKYLLDSLRFKQELDEEKNRKIDEEKNKGKSCY